MECYLSLCEDGVDVFAQIGFVVHLFGLVTEFLYLLVGGFEEVGVCQEFLYRVADVHHESLELWISLRMAHDLIELLFELLPLPLITKRAD